MRKRVGDAKHAVEDHWFYVTVVGLVVLGLALIVAVIEVDSTTATQATAWAATHLS